MGDLSVPGYTILKKITDGGSASVFKARKHPYEQVVALKVLLPQLTAKKEMVRAFDREGAFLSRLKHPNVIRSGGRVKDAPRPTIELELFESVTLKGMVARASKLGIRETARIVKQVAEALSYVHSQRIAHLDVKPENILVSDKLDVRLIDFSIAHELDRSISDRLLGIFGSKSADGAIQGTITYLSPEQIRRENPGEKADVYALGLVLHECLTGGPPFRGHDPKALMRQHLHDAPEPVAKARPDTPLDMAELVAKMLEKVPERRPDATGAAQVLAKHAG
jgi:serine/threonine-protein kinase